MYLLWKLILLILKFVQHEQSEFKCTFCDFDFFWFWNSSCIELSWFFPNTHYTFLTSALTILSRFFPLIPMWTSSSVVSLIKSGYLVLCCKWSAVSYCVNYFLHDCCKILSTCQVQVWRWACNKRKYENRIGGTVWWRRGGLYIAFWSINL